MNNLASSIIKFRWAIILIVLAMTVFLGIQIGDMQINSDVISSLPDDDPDALLFKKIGKDFGGNKIGMIVLESDNIFSNEVIQHVWQLSDSLSMLDGINSVTSITNILEIKGGEDGFSVGELIDEYELPFSDEQLSDLEKRVMAKDMYRGSLVSEDGTSTVVMFSLSEDAIMRDVSGNVITLTESLNLPETIYYAGLPMMVFAISQLIAADLMLLLPIAFLVIAIVLMFSFRSFKGVALPLVTSAIAIVWTIGLMVLLGYEMTMVSNNVPILLLAVGSAYSIHVVNKVNQVREKDYRKAIVTALAYIFIPVALAAVTTMVGFVSFVFEAYLTMIKDFGTFTAIGTFISAILALFFVPALLFGLTSKNRKYEDYNVAYKKSVLSDTVLKPLNNLLVRHPKSIVVFWIIQTILGTFAIFLIERNVDIKDYFQEGDISRRAEEIMTEKFGGSKPIFVLFNGDIQDPEVLNMMLKTEDSLKQNPHVYSTQSIANLIVDLNDALGEGRRIPEDREMIEQLWFLIDGNPALEQLVNDDLDEAVIISKFDSGTNDDKKELATQINNFIDNNRSDKFKIQATGMPFIDLKMNQSLLRSQIRSLIIAIVALLIIVAFVLRSFSAGVYATVPIIAAIIVLFGMMGIASIPLNMATVLVASVTLGIGIDYSIHVITSFMKSFKNGRDAGEALEETIMISGKAIFINVISVTAGFIVLIFSKMVPLQYFGILMALAMLGSGLAALTLLPAILVLVHRNKPTEITHENKHNE